MTPFKRQTTNYQNNALHQQADNNKQILLENTKYTKTDSLFETNKYTHVLEKSNKVTA